MTPPPSPPHSSPGASTPLRASNVPTPHLRSGVPRPIDPPRIGVRIAGTGMCLPEQRVTNKDLEKIMDTSDGWIVQRTGIRERRFVDPTKGESATTISAEALRRALANASLPANALDLVIVGTVSGEMACPSTACRVAALVGAGNAGAFDVTAACCGFVFSLNLAHDLIRCGSYRSVGVVGCDVLSPLLDPANRSVAVIFGDAAGAAVVRATDDASKGMIAQVMHADGSRWPDLYIPRAERDIPEGADRSGIKLNALQMNGREVYKFAVGTFSRLIEETLEKAGMSAEQVDHFVCHQSNARILDSARERFGIPQEKMYVNIDRIGNTSAGSVPVCLAELRTAGRIKEGDVVMFVAFGGGLTWGSSLWQL